MKLKSVYRLISPEHRRRLPAIVLSALGSAMVDLVGIAALVSVLLVVLDENILHTNPLFASLYSALGFGSEGAFIAAVCVVVLVLIALKGVVGVALGQVRSRYML